MKATIQSNGTKRLSAALFATTTLLAAMLLATACEETLDLPEAAETEVSPPSTADLAFANLPAADRADGTEKGQASQPSFDFNLTVSNCLAGGSMVSVNIANSAAYAYLWEVDGKPGGHAMKINCACGDYAKVRVTRLSDGVSRFKSVPLPDCGGDH